MKLSLLALGLFLAISTAHAQKSKLTCNPNPKLSKTTAPATSAISTAQNNLVQKPTTCTISTAEKNLTDLQALKADAIDPLNFNKGTATSTSSSVTGLTDDFIKNYIKVFRSSGMDGNSKEGIKMYLNNLKQFEQQYDKQIADYEQKLKDLNDPKKSQDVEAKQKQFDEIKSKMSQVEAEYSTIFGQDDLSAEQKKEKMALLQKKYNEYNDQLQPYYKSMGGYYGYGAMTKENLQQALTQFKQQKEEYTKQAKQYEAKLAEIEAKDKDQSKKPDGAISDEDRKYLETTISKTVSAAKARSQYTDCGLTDVELFSIMLYTGNAYGPINSALRNGDTESIAQYQFMIDTINSGLDKLGKYDGVVKRGLSMDADTLKQYCEGCTVTMKAFTSTSTENGFSGQQKFVMKSKDGVYIAPVSFITKEEEVLFKTDSKFKIVQIKGNEYTMEQVE